MLFSFLTCDSGRSTFSKFIANVRAGNLQIVSVLLERRLVKNINDADERGNTPLMAAAEAGHLEIAKTLLAHGANPDARNFQEQTAAEIAFETNHQPIAEMLGWTQDKKLYICPMYCTDVVADSAIRCSVCNMEFEDKYVVENPKDHHIIFPREAWKMLQSDTSIVLLDVRRTLEQFEELGKLPRSVNIPIDELERRMAELGTFRKRTLIAYCSHGIRSARAAVALTRKGFKVISLQGGLTKWNRDGLPVERPKRTHTGE